MISRLQYEGSCLSVCLYPNKAIIKITKPGKIQSHSSLQKFPQLQKLDKNESVLTKHKILYILVSTVHITPCRHYLSFTLLQPFHALIYCKDVWMKVAQWEKPSPLPPFFVDRSLKKKGKVCNRHFHRAGIDAALMTTLHRVIFVHFQKCSNSNVPLNECTFQAKFYADFW